MISQHVGPKIDRSLTLQILCFDDATKMHKFARLISPPLSQRSAASRGNNDSSQFARAWILLAEMILDQWPNKNEGGVFLVTALIYI